ncbi:MAG: hypothetical protein E7455_06440 [Ruminococcaceae bacterium]|nr:hypothetical protein [Oscillospiraceae bacterium]
MMYFDTAAFCGHWPFYHVRNAGLEQMLERYRTTGIDGGLMSSLDAVFYQDPWEADRELVQALAGTHWRVAMSVNPMMPWAEQLLVQGKEAGVGAVRLYPCVHGYDEDDPRVVELCRLAGKLGLPVIITARMEDGRMCYLHEQRNPDMGKISRLARECGQTRFLVSNCLVAEAKALLPLPENLWLDTAGFRADFFLETQQDIPPERFLFGSFAPLQCINSAVCVIPEDGKQQFMCENAQAFLE